MKEILVVQTGKLGDMVCATPVFRAIKSHYRDAGLCVAGDSINKEVLEGNPYVDEYVVVNDLGSVLQKRKFDACILLNPNPRILWLLLKTRQGKIIAPRVVGGFSPYQTKKYRLLLWFVTVVPHRMGSYAPQEYLNALNPIGIVSSDTVKELCTTKEAEERASVLFASYEGRLKIAISPSAGNKIKEWPPVYFAEIAKRVQEKYKAVVVLIGGSKDLELRSAVCSHMPQVETLDLVGKLSVAELKACMKKVDLFVAVDTGPIYVAEAFGIPTVDIVGPMDEREQPPRGEKHKVVYLKDRSAPMLHIMNARMYDEKEARRQIESITPDMVMEEIEELLKSY